MTSRSALVPISPAARLTLLAAVMASIGAISTLSLVSSSRVEPGLLALPIGLGLLTRGAFWRIAAFAYCALHLAITFGIVPVLLRLATSQPAATATGLAAPPSLSFLSVSTTMFLVSFGFTVLRQPEVKVLFHGARLSPGV